MAKLINGTQILPVLIALAQNATKPQLGAAAALKFNSLSVGLPSVRLSLGLFLVYLEHKVI